ncbi:MAG: hypothetical protein OXR84_12080 [Magnetovibrio sp.]|nr:hypothetical protein [Magnetovibrio sp.]
MSGADVAEFHSCRQPLAVALFFFLLLIISEAFALSQAALFSDRFFAAAVALAFCGLIVLVLARRMRDPTPQVAFAGHGVFAKSVGGEWIAWDQVTGIGFMEKKRPPLAPKRPRLVIMVGTTGIQEEVRYREGGMSEIAAAVDRFMPKDTDGERADAWRENKRQWELA